ncbi:MAG: DUF4394 domain-containing protein [Gemmataceae bacterium]|nr:DUF4394 domain-containing protein [Gemmataceae bacterium]
MTANPLRLWNRWTRSLRSRLTATRTLKLTALEDRMTPATLFGLNAAANQLYIFDSATPGTVTTLNVTGLGAGERLQGIDFRPADLKLYGLTDANLKTYQIDINTGAATAIGAAGVGTLSTQYGFDFNPVVDRLRVVGDMGNNLRLNPNNGALVSIDTGINGATTSLMGAAYTNSFAGTTSTTLYGIDSKSDSLYIVSTPNNGTTSLVGSLGVDAVGDVGFDIAYDDGVAYASFTVGGVSKLFSVNLATGAATDLGTIGTGTVAITGLTAKYTTNVPPVVTFSSSVQTYDIQSDVPVLLDPNATITDLDSLNFNGGSLLVQFAFGLTGDLLDIQNQGNGAGQVGTSGGKVFFGGVEVGTYLTGDGAIIPLVVTFNANATPAAAQAILRAVTFSATSNDLTTNNPRIATAKVDDGDGATGVSNTHDVKLADLTPPAVTSINIVGTSPTNAKSVDYTVTFTEDVTGVDITDFKLSGAATGSVASVTMVDGKTYTVTVNTVAGNGSLRLDLIDDDSITDAAGNKLGGTGTGNGDFKTGQAYTIDNIAPIGIIVQDMGQTDPAFGQPVVFFVNFSETVTGFDSSDIIITGTAPGTLVATVTPVVGSTTDFTISVTGATGDGTVIVNFAADAAFDLAGNGSEAGIAFDNTVTLDLTNDAPVITGPASVTGTEDTKLTFTGGNAISINDSDLNGGELLVTLTATNGTLTLATLTGLTFVTGDGTADATMSFKGTQANVNAALLTLEYNPTLNFNGAATLTIDADDQGNTGTGGAKTSQKVVDLTIDAVNDGPTVTITGTFTTPEDTKFSFPTGSIVIADVDAGTDAIEVTLTITNGTISLADFSKLTFITGDGTDDSTMKFTGKLADINAAFDGLSFTPSLNSTATGVLNVSVDDLGHNGTGGSLTGTGSASITVTAVNDSPTINGPTSVSFDEDTTFTFTGADLISISDVDAGTGALKVSVSTTNGTLTLSGIVGLTFTTGDGTGDASMTFTGTLSAINTALAGMKLAPVANFNGAATVTITADDQGNTGGTSTPATKDIAVTVNAVNDAPVAVNDSFTTLQNLPITISAPGVLANDTDTEGSTLTAILVTNVPAAAGTLTLASNGGFTYTPAPNFVGVVTFQYKANDGTTDSNVATVTITVNEKFTRTFATGAGAGGTSHVVVHNEDGSIRFSFDAFDPAFAGGVAVATGDVNGDGIEDVIVGAGPGGGPHVRVLSGLDLGQIHSFYAFAQTFTGGVHVAAADVNNDGLADVIVGAGEGGGPHVRVFDGKTGSVIQDFFAYDALFTGGVNVAGGDFNGDGNADIVTGAGPGGSPHVMVYAGGSGQILKSFMAFDTAFTGGVQVAAGESNGKAAIFTAAGAGGVPVVSIFDFDTGSAISSFFAFDQSVTSGVRIGTEVQSDGSTVLFLAPGIGQTPTVRTVDADTLQDVMTFNAYDPAFLGGVFIG